MDILSSSERSRIMGRIRSKDTQPEMIVRRLVYSLGYRYRLHWNKLPGRPDLTFTRKHKVIFVHGCFWHRHRGCSKSRLPKSNRAYWTPKLNANRARDQRTLKALARQGWDSLVIWECEIDNDLPMLESRIRAFLDDAPTSTET